MRHCKIKHKKRRDEFMTGWSILNYLGTMASVAVLPTGAKQILTMARYSSATGNGLAHHRTRFCILKAEAAEIGV